MNIDTNYVGIDISKDSFDIFSGDLGHKKYSNDKKGFKEFKKLIDRSHWCLMESTGSYHQQLAATLFNEAVRVSVINPMIIKRFIQMKLKRIKTDKSDAEMLSQYGREQELDLWEPLPIYVAVCKDIQSTLQLYFKQSTALKNNIHSLKSRGERSGILIRSLTRQLKHLRKEIEKLEVELEKQVKVEEQDLLSRLTTIPGIGKKTALLMIIATNGFRSFESQKQLVSFLGLAPCERTSGSSIRGKSRINKGGNSTTRNHLFLCSFTACQRNPQCKALYDRLVSKGKSKKLALIAVCNKLVRQAYGIAKSNLVYDPKHHSKLA